MKTKNVLRKIALSILALALIIPSVYLGQSLANDSVIEAQAADSKSFLDVKLQAKPNTAEGGYDVRFVSSIDKLRGYKQVGFVLEFAEKKYVASTNTVYTRIGASLDNLEYSYSPKVVDVDSEYFITAVFHVPAEQVSENLKVNAFYIGSGLDVTAANRTLGETRIVNISDGNVNQISMRVDTALEIGMTYDVTVGELEGTATALDEYNVRINLGETADKTTLPSVSEVTLYGDEVIAATGSYRNLHSTGTNDTSAFANYSSEDKFIIASQADMYGFSVKSNETNCKFGDKKVYMVSDITLNTVDKVNWKTGVASDETYTISSLTPIGKTSSAFEGTFDGQGHTLRGVYVNSDATYVGLFHTISADATVSNFKLEDSYIVNAKTDGTRNGTGSIAGRLTGTIDTVYSNATVTNGKQMTGGLAGMASGTTGKIINSWFDGEINATTSVGGLLGGSYGAVYTTIQHCLNSGTVNISADSYDIGGFVGRMQAGAAGMGTTIEDCMNVGTYINTDEKTITRIGNILGRIDGSDVTQTITINNSYGVDDFASGLYGSNTSDTATISNTGSDVVTSAKLQGYRAANNTTLSFASVVEEGADVYWVLQYGNAPRLAAFDEEDIDVSWYDESASEYTISTVEELFGFNDLSEDADYFAGKTVKLGANITVNPKWTASVDATTPDKTWTPKAFSGDFVGNGYTISGLYAKETGHVGFFSTMNDGSTVTNLKITNSYFEGTTSSNSERKPVGSVAGQCGGIIDTVYSDAILKNEAMMVGGIAGMAYEGTDITIKNCWFDGEIKAKNSIGGILGGSYETTATVEHCLNTGTITLSANTSYFVGGIIGHLQNAGANVTLNDCLNAGTYDENSKTCASVGTLAGRGNGTSALTVTNSYGVEGFATGLYGKQDASATITNTGNTSAVRYLADLNGYGAYQWTKLDFEDVDGEDEDKVYWVLKNGTIPALAVFDTTDLDLATAKTKLDHTWYDLNNKTNLVIDTKDELLSFNEICDSTRNYFAGHTVYLGADIDLNEGWTASATAPTNGTTWTPIDFKGTFIGQNHAISGLYATSTKQAGLFATLYGSVSELQIRNSYIAQTKTYTSSRNGAGSVAGYLYGGGSVSTVYSDAIIENNGRGTGGICGFTYHGTKNTASSITNCWFDGSVYSTQYGTGGILGINNNTAVTIQNCLNTGTVGSSNAFYIGGIVGYLQTAGTVTIDDCLNAGSISSVPSGSSLGSLIGAGTVGTLNINNSYGITEFATNWYGNSGTNTGVATGSTPYSGAKKTYYNTGASNLDFTTYWLAKENSTPILKSFAELMVAETNWYDADSAELTIIDAQQLLGFNKLGASNNFSGKKIYLEADVTLNDGNASDWAAAAPDYVWTPIKELSGEFYGNGHTISGFYIKDGGQVGMFKKMNTGSIVSDLKVTNSYIQGTGTSSRQSVGTIVGQCHGTIEKVYSDAILTNSSQMTGGIAGMVATNMIGTIENCWFDGKIIAVAQSCGGILGGTYTATANISHCLNTGEIYSTLYTKPKHGGLFGDAQQSSTINISDSFNAGTYTRADGAASSGQVGTIAGCINNTSTCTLNNAYGVREFIAKDIGYINDETEPYATVTISDGREKCWAYRTAFVGTGAANLDYTNYWTARTTSTPMLTHFAVAYEAVKGWQLDPLPIYETESATLSTALYSTGAYISTYTAQAAIDNAAAKATKMQSVEGTTKDELVVYADKLVSEGYTIASHTSIENNIFYRFTKDSTRVYVNYYGNTERATIEVDDSGNPFAFESSVSYAKTDADTADTEYYLYALRMAEKRDNDTTGYPENGAAMIVKCADNSIIMIDGGAAAQMNTEAEQTRLYNFLKEITGQSEVENAVINISAWFITHFDSDHCAGFAEALIANPERYNVQRLVCNLPDETVVLNANNEIIKTELVTIVGKVKTALTPYTACQEVKLRTGDVLTICGVDITTLFTHTDAANASVDGYFIPASNSLFNATSTIAQFTSPEGMKMLVTGDMFDDTETVLCNNFSATTLNTDILQQPHHNSSDVSEIYSRASAQVMFFTQRRTIVDIKWWKDYDEYQNAQKAKNACSEYYCGGSETVGFKWDSTNNKAVKSYHSELTY